MRGLSPDQRYEIVLRHLQLPPAKVQPNDNIQLLKRTQEGRSIHRSAMYYSIKTFKGEFVMWRDRLVDIIAVIAQRFPLEAIKTGMPTLDKSSTCTFKEPKPSCNRCRAKVETSKCEKRPQRYYRPHLYCTYQCNCKGKRPLYCLTCMIVQWLHESQERHHCYTQGREICYARCKGCGVYWNPLNLILFFTPQGTGVHPICEHRYFPIICRK